MAGYPLFPNGHVALFSPPFPKNFQESMLELPTDGTEEGKREGGLVFSGRQFCLAAHFPHESAANLSHELLIANLVPNRLVAAVPTPPQRHGYYIKVISLSLVKIISAHKLQFRLDPRHS